MNKPISSNLRRWKVDSWDIEQASKPIETQVLSCLFLAFCPEEKCVHFLGLPWQIITNWVGLVTTETYSVRVVKAQVWNRDVVRAVLPPMALRRKASLLLSASDGHRHLLACGSITPISSPIFTWNSPLCVCVSQISFYIFLGWTHWIWVHPKSRVTSSWDL